MWAISVKVFRKLIVTGLIGLALLAGLSSVIAAQTKSACTAFQETVKSTYNFRPSLLANESERKKKSAAMDKIWEAVKANQNELLPCLRQALDDPASDAWFRFDGSNLLVSLDPSEASKKLQIKNYAATILEDVDLRVWVMTLVRRAQEGFDVSAPGEKWMSFPKAKYFLPEHGLFVIGVYSGGLFIFGSMDEALATPALIRIASQPDHPGREVALGLLLDQNTAESLRFLRQLKLSTLHSKLRNRVSEELTRPDFFEPRSKPRTSRKEFVDAFENFINGKPGLFLELVDKVSDGEKDVVATMTADDLPLLRKMRRRMIAGGNQHSIAFYDSFTKIIRTLVRKDERK